MTFILIQIVVSRELQQPRRATHYRNTKLAVLSKLRQAFSFLDEQLLPNLKPGSDPGLTPNLGNVI
jgi:hypothetical protein